MLILTRKKNESIIIDDDIKIKILELDNNRVQIGIEAPEYTIIHREEVYQEIQNENKIAASINKELPSNLSSLLKMKLKSSKIEKKD